jgi:hypothetical protein
VEGRRPRLPHRRRAPRQVREAHQGPLPALRPVQRARAAAATSRWWCWRRSRPTACRRWSGC